MKFRFLCTLLLLLALRAACAQDLPPDPAQEDGQGNGAWQGQRNGRGGDRMAFGRGSVGTVTEVTADHFTIKTELGEIYTVHFSVNTRILKQPAPRHSQDARGQQQHSQDQRRQDQRDQAQRGQDQRGQDQRGQDWRGEERTPPQPIKATEIKVGDVIAASGEEDAAAKSIGAVFILLLDPERARQMREMEANYGKTWLMGKVTAIVDLKITVEGGPDRASHSFVADENTSFRKRREPITLADIQVGDMVRVEGTVKAGTFLATTVAVMSPPPNRETLDPNP